MSKLILFFCTIFHHCLGDQVEQLDKQMDEQKSLHSILQAQIKRQERSVKTSCTQIENWRIHSLERQDLGNKKCQNEKIQVVKLIWGFENEEL